MNFINPSPCEIITADPDQINYLNRN